MDLHSLWDRLIQGMQQRIGHQDVEIWLRPSVPIALEGHTLVLEVANRYYADWIGDNYADQLRDEANAGLGLPLEVEFSFRDEPTAELQPPVMESSHTPALPVGARSVGVNPAQSFDNFVVGECNKFAHAAARAVSDFPASNYNPLFIYGATGLGKTHLMHAIGNVVLRTKRSSKVVYVTAENFMNEMIGCLRQSRMEEFRQKYRRRATVLLVDDVQALAGRERTQEEFFHTFNALQANGRQIVLTSDMVPSKIDKLAPRLRTRFEGGLLADMQAPDKETLLAILAQKAERLSLDIPVDLADAIAANVAGNIRELEGLLNRLSAKRSFYRQPLTLSFARECLPDVFNPAPPEVTVAGIIEAVARFHSLRSADITGSKRTRTVTRPRHIAMYLARKHTQFSFPELGREFGDRDHTTIQHGVKRIERQIGHDPDLDCKIELIEKGLMLRR